MCHDDAYVGNVCVGEEVGVGCMPDLGVAGRVLFEAVLVYEKVDAELVYAMAEGETGLVWVAVGYVEEWVVVAGFEYERVGVEYGRVGVEEVGVVDVKEGEHEGSFVKIQWDSEYPLNYSVEQD